MKTMADYFDFLEQYWLIFQPPTQQKIPKVFKIAIL